jgi:hypothetical protein
LPVLNRGTATGSFASPSSLQVSVANRSYTPLAPRKIPAGSPVRSVRPVYCIPPHLPQGVYRGIIIQ